MFGYMTELSTVEESSTEEITAQGSSIAIRPHLLTLHNKLITPPTLPSLHFPPSTSGDDLESLLFHFMDEFLFTFSADPFFIPKVSHNG